MINNPALDSAVEKLAEHLEEYLKSQGISIDPATKKFKCINPEHNDSTPSSFIVPESGGKVFHCFGCGASGTIFHAANWIESLPKTGPGWLNITMDALCKRYNIVLPTIELTPEQKELLEAQKVYQEAGQIIRYSTSEVHTPIFAERGWDDNIGVRYGVGFVRGYENFIKDMRSAGYDEPFLERMGLRRRDIFNENAMIFCIQNHHGQVVGFASRNLNYQGDGVDTLPKYTNTSSESPLYKKREILYGLHIAKTSATKQGLVLVEGYADWISLQEAGVKNVAAICGTALTKEHIHLLLALGITRITLCLDNDDPGQLATLRALDDVIGETPSIQVDIMQLPEGFKDPDEFLKAYEGDAKAQAWGQLRRISCFEYRLSRFPADMPGEQIANKMVPLIVTEPNTIFRERMIKELARKTDIRVSAIQKEVDRMSSLEEYRSSEQVQAVVTAAVKDLTKDPSSARETFSHYLSIVEQMYQANSTDLVGPEEGLNEFNMLSEEWMKTKKDKVIGIPTHMINLDMATNGLQEGRVIGIGGKPNHGKSAFVLSVAHNVATKNPNTIVLIHSTDDSREVVYSRLTAIDQDLEINQVTNPKAYFRLREPLIIDGKTIAYDPTLTAKWKQGKENIMKLISDGKIVVKDSTHGTTLGFTETMIKYYKEHNPDKRILVIFDNFHKAQDFIQYEERIRFKKMSHQCKYLAEKYHVAFIATMEYTKLRPGTRPENSDLAETVQMEYDLSMILHVYNELKDIGIDKAKLVTILEDGAETTTIPIVDIRVGKNKQTAFQDKLYYNFYPGRGKFVETTAEVAIQAERRGVDRRLEGLGQS